MDRFKNKYYSLATTGQGMKWYLTKTIHEKITIKDTFYLLCGVKFSDLSFMFSFSERVDMMYQKLLLEGFIVEEGY